VRPEGLGKFKNSSFKYLGSNAGTTEKKKIQKEYNMKGHFTYYSGYTSEIGNNRQEKFVFRKLLYVHTG
jgi:hypothetical protein